MSTGSVGEMDVLVVDDNADLVEVVAEFLEREHDAITAVTATDTDAALDRLDGEIDCIVSDYDMPGTDGLAFLDAVREERPDLPFILFTGKGSEEIASEAISAGVTDYLQKGAGTDQYKVLANRIERAVGERRARTEQAETERQLTTLIENLNGMVYRCRNARGWPMEFVSDGCEELTGYAPDDIESGRVSWGEDVIHLDDREETWAAVQRAVDAGDAFEVQYRIRRRDGDVRWCWERGRPVDGGDGDATVLEGFITDITPRKRRETELEAERELTESVLDALEDVFFVVDPETEAFVRWNERAVETTGYGDEELTTMQATDVIAEDHRKRVRAAMAEAVETGTATVEADVVTADGERVPHEFRGTAIRDEDGVVGIGGIGRDVSERKARERTLERYRTLVENVGDPMYVLDDEGTVEMVNSAMVEHLGYDRGEIEGATPDLFMSESDVARGTEVIVDLLKSDEAACETWEMEVVREDGTTVHSETQTGTITDDGEFVGSVGVIRDITDRVERERELQRYETVVQAVGDPVYVLDEGGVVQFVNDAFVEMTGYDVGTLVDSHVGRILGDDDLERGRDHIRELLSAPDRRATKFEVDVETADGDEIPSEFHIALLPADDGSFRGTAGIIRDIERRKHREERLEEFASVVSHDLRGPLTVIRSQAELAKQTHDLSELDAIEDAAERMAELIDELLTLARQGDTVGDAEPVAVDSVAREAWQSVSAPEGTLDSWATQEVSADPDRLRELFENLFRNAVEHGRSDVTLVVDGLGDDAGFYVADDGPGIPESERDDVFDHGYTTDDQGTGFGLSIVERIAEAHGWTVTVTDSESGGARFEFRTD